ncbi:hypothetical protein QJS66_02395 [Kocuria rhizophila]|nr:hypothetical protein QJS66_02395 [Kocuria rhizophila]
MARLSRNRRRPAHGVPPGRLDGRQAPDAPTGQAHTRVSTACSSSRASTSPELTAAAMLHPHAAPGPPHRGPGLGRRRCGCATCGDSSPGRFAQAMGSGDARGPPRRSWWDAPTADLSPGARTATAEHPPRRLEPDPANPASPLAALNTYRDDVADPRDVAVPHSAGPHQGCVPPGPTMSRSATLPARTTPTAWNSTTRPTRTPSARSRLMRWKQPLWAGEFERHLPTSERINHTALQRMVLIAMQAFRQRALKGRPAPKIEGRQRQIDHHEIFEADPGPRGYLPAAVEAVESAGRLHPGAVLHQGLHDRARGRVDDAAAHDHRAASEGSAEGVATQREAVIFKIESTSRRADTAIRRATSAALRMSGHEDRASVEKLTRGPTPPAASLTERAELARGASSRRAVELHQEVCRAHPRRGGRGQSGTQDRAARAGRAAPTMTAAGSTTGQVKPSDLRYLDVLLTAHTKATISLAEMAVRQLAALWMTVDQMKPRVAPVRR